MYVEIDGLHCSVIDIDTIDTKKHFGFIYVTINKLNGKLYLGKKAFRLKNGKVNAWRSYLGSGKEIKRQIQQYGKENFTRYILALGRTSDELTQLEIEYIRKFGAHESGKWLNVRVGSALIRGKP
ncbi:hypothetical protein SAMN04487921_13723 [Bacillus altitudinis]|uniref:GIY-YIG nuclease family protein n=1 Tax=Bacillus altitudinis TaxID=293387 RepID=UPI000912FC14|nr:GIY-YIG nuclease family protein [Bacillus altitudinis]SFY28120.1 hypothetical protein SAMN04487921_13723 [Bacillus altitudinis]SNS79218.1 hypothetical protein SAMN05880584_13423 [Bacillus altitudinis]